MSNAALCSYKPECSYFLQLALSHPQILQENIHRKCASTYVMLLKLETFKFINNFYFVYFINVVPPGTPKLIPRFGTERNYATEFPLYEMPLHK